MKKHIIVKQQHRYTKERKILFNGVAEYQLEANLLLLNYVETDTRASVSLRANSEGLTIERNGEVTTLLYLQEGMKTTGEVMSEFGSFDLELHTHKYIKKENIIAIEYDVLASGEVTDGYYVIWTIKEGMA